jgi:hypothetical protein
VIKNQIKKKRKGNKMVSQKVKRGGKKLDKKAIKPSQAKRGGKIKVLAHELLASTLSYLILAPW